MRQKAQPDAGDVHRRLDQFQPGGDAADNVGILVREKDAANFIGREIAQHLGQHPRHDTETTRIQQHTGAFMHDQILVGANAILFPRFALIEQNELVKFRIEQLDVAHYFPRIVSRNSLPGAVPRIPVFTTRIDPTGGKI